MASDHGEVSSKLEPWRDLKGKVVMVTGASSGIGWEFCTDLAKAGCKIIAAARRIDRLKSLCDRINQNQTGGESSGLKAAAIALDISGESSAIEAAVQKAWDSFGHIDALINNAGITGKLLSPLDISEEQWNSTMNTNLTGSWLVSKFVCRRMHDAGQGGSVINIASINGMDRGYVPGGLAYSASKAALSTATKVMAMELGMDNIRVNAICPGLFKSEITAALMEQDWLKTVAYKAVPLRTWGTTDPALTSLARYLIHDSSSYVSGNIFIADAGLTLLGIPIFSSL